MSRKLSLIIAITLWGFAAVAPEPATAQTPLTRAVIQNLLNRVKLIPQNQRPRDARRQDPVTPGDAVSTARSSRAELRFNDGSLARVGELALFRFYAGTRNFRLSNGTLLLLIPPGKGRTNVQTPNASAGIRGSGLFVRYDAQTDTTIVGALTNNPQGPMTITNKDGSQQQDLKAGEMVVIIKNRIERIYKFDLNTFYETSDIVRGLDLPQKSSAANPDQGIAAVQAETSQALLEQQGDSIQGNDVIENPVFAKLSPQPSDFFEEVPQVVKAPEPAGISSPRLLTTPIVTDVSNPRNSQVDATLGGRPAGGKPAGRIPIPAVPDRPALSDRPPLSDRPVQEIPSLPIEVPSVTPPGPSLPEIPSLPGEIPSVPLPDAVPIDPIPRPIVLPPTPVEVPKQTPPVLTPIEVPKQTPPVPVEVPKQTPPVLTPIEVPRQTPPVSTPVYTTPRPTPVPVEVPRQTPPVPTPIEVPRQTPPVLTPVYTAPRPTPVPIEVPRQTPPVPTPIEVPRQTPPVLTPIEVPRAQPTLQLEVAPTTPVIQSPQLNLPTPVQVPSPTPNLAPTVTPTTEAPSLAPSLGPTTAPVLPVEGKIVPNIIQAQPATKSVQP